MHRQMLVVADGGTQFYSFAATNIEVSKLTKIMRALLSHAKFMHYAKRWMYGNKFAPDQRTAAVEGQKQAARQMIDEFNRFCRGETQALS